VTRALARAGGLAAVTALVPGSVRAETEQAARCELAASVGGALPFCSIEAGSALRDVSFAATPFELALSYLTTGPWSASVAGGYAVSIPTLCANSSDCVASLGRDVSFTLAARYAAPSLGRLRPTVSLGVGYEWFTSKLSARGATSSRSLHGFLAPMVDLDAGFVVGRRWKLGPFLRASAGRFTGGTLHVPTGEEASLAQDSRWHGWLELGFRTSLRR